MNVAKKRSVALCSASKSNVKLLTQTHDRNGMDRSEREHAGREEGGGDPEASLRALLGAAARLFHSFHKHA